VSAFLILLAELVTLPQSLAQARAPHGGAAATGEATH
jgi:hypothetical protein